MRIRFGLICALVFVCLVSCVSVPRRIYEADEMKLSPDDNEYVAFWKVGEYIKSIMENVKGYAEPIIDASESASDLIMWLYVAISGIMFIAGFACFAVAALTHAYKFNFVGFLCLIGAGVAAGFAEFANWWWTIPATGIIGVIIWFITHQTKGFSLIESIKNLWSKRNGNH